METDKRSAAIGKLNPLCTLRYSATHRNRYNLVYSLNPVKAYDLGLVKQIEVDSVMEENSANGAFVSLESITATKTKVTAKITIHVNDKEGVKTKSVNVRAGDDLYKLSNEREIYKDGYIIEEIDAANDCISLSNGNVLYKGQTQGALTDTYSLIMKDKEKLLDIENPLRFIFSHSALREGWDNPNVFQICTLNETKSDMKKRQEIGRGLRLAVNQDGVRLYDRNINRLTVIANESYNDFAKALQQEIETDCGVEFKDRIKNLRERKTVKYRKGFEADPRFLEIWEKLKQKTTYRVNYKTDDLIKTASEKIKNLPPINEPSIRSTKVKITMNGKTGIDTQYLAEKPISYRNHSWLIPDVLGYIQSKTELTRSTIMAILTQSGRLNDVTKNPQLFLDLTSSAIKRVLYGMMIDGIK